MCAMRSFFERVLLQLSLNECLLSEYQLMVCARLLPSLSRLLTVATIKNAFEERKVSTEFHKLTKRTKYFRLTLGTTRRIFYMLQMARSVACKVNSTLSLWG